MYCVPLAIWDVAAWLGEAWSQTKRIPRGYGRRHDGDFIGMFLAVFTKALLCEEERKEAPALFSTSEEDVRRAPGGARAVGAVVPKGREREDRAGLVSADGCPATDHRAWPGPALGAARRPIGPTWPSPSGI